MSIHSTRGRHRRVPVVFAQTAASLKVDVGLRRAPVIATLSGLMTEEINYSYDGGLYAQHVLPAHSIQVLEVNLAVARSLYLLPNHEAL